MQKPRDGRQGSAPYPLLPKIDRLQPRKAECEAILHQLLVAPRVSFNKALRSLVPKGHGLYAIADKRRRPNEFLHAGKTKTGKDGLRGRVWDSHYNHATTDGDLIKKVQSRKKLDKQAAKKWVEDNCVVQWVEVADERLRNWVEHYVLAILQPIWGS